MCFVLNYEIDAICLDHVSAIDLVIRYRVAYILIDKLVNYFLLKVYLIVFLR